MGRHRIEQESKDLPPLSLRIREVLSGTWEGNAKRMSRELDVPYLSIIRALNGSDPHTRLLSALVQKAGIDAHWLLTGSYYCNV